MKHRPIENPHSRINQIIKKTKNEEKDDLIATTKTQVLEKYGANRQKKKTVQTGGIVIEGGGDRGFQLEEKKDKMTVGIRLLSEGYMQAYVDFFYLTQETTPSSIEPSDRLIEEQKLNKQRKRSLEQTPQMLIQISEDLKSGERFHRDAAARDCFRIYLKMA